MKKKITVGTTVVLILLAALLAFELTFHFVGLQYQAKVDTLTKTQADFSLLAEADPLIRQNFFGEIDDEKVESGLLQGYVASLGDPYSAYLTAEEYTRYQKERESQGSAIGVRLTYDASSKNVIVYSVFNGSPAQSEGILPGDVLTEIDGQSVKDLSFYQVLEALSGEKGTQVSLSVRREIAMQILDMNFTLTRENTKANSISYSVLDGNVGYVQIFSFDTTTSEELEGAINALTSAQVRGILWDVRNTTGGDALVAVKTLDRLLPEGVLVRTVDQLGQKKELTSNESCLDLPMAILVNSASSFSAEIFASVMKDYGKAILVGETTHGKSLEQKIVELDNGSALLLSAMAYQPPLSPSFESIGVEPDISVKLEGVNFYLLEQKNDPQLSRARLALLGENNG